MKNGQYETYTQSIREDNPETAAGTSHGDTKPTDGRRKKDSKEQTAGVGCTRERGAARIRMNGLDRR